MTKYQMVMAICDSWVTDPWWVRNVVQRDYASVEGGARDFCKHYTKEEIKEMYDEMRYSEEE